MTGVQTCALPIFYLWNVQVQPANNQFDSLSYNPKPGDKFGAFDMGVPVFPSLGGPAFYVSANMYSDHAVVPEPATIALSGLGLVCLIASLRQRK